MVDYRFIDDKAEKRKIQNEAGITLLHDIIRDKCGFEITESDIVRGEWGKPYLRENNEVYFSISHCDGLCSCIVCSSECGIDCEKIRDFRPNVIKRIFTANETKWFDRIDPHDKPRFFFILWTLKEAYGKYTGRGIADMKNVSFSFENGHLSSDKPGLDFFVYEYNGYLLSICVEKGVKPQCSFGNRIY